MNALSPTGEELVAIARRAASDGARIIIEELAQTGVSAKGQPGDIVTHLDIASERRIRHTLAEARPQDRVVGEELDDAGIPEATLRWSIDPLDGTTNRVKGMPFFATSVAVQNTSTGQWLAGAVNAPALGKEYFATLGAGAYLREGTDVSRLRGPRPGTQTRLLGTGLSYDPDVRLTQLETLGRHMTHFDDMRSIGSAALGLCAVADGSVDAFWESDLYEFDWAAGALIAEEAGAVVERPAHHRGGVVAYFGSDFRS